MKALSVLAALFYVAPAFASQPLLALSSDQLNYAVGATAHLVAMPLVAPKETEDDFYMGATLNGVAVALNQSTNGPGIYTAVLSQAGSYTFTVQLYLENAKFAHSLSDAIFGLTLSNNQITTELGQTTDPTQIAALQAQQATNNNEIALATQELARIRKPFGASQTLTFGAR